MNVQFKILSRLADNIRLDLERPHAFAAERVGFISCRAGRVNDGLVLLAHQYHPVEDGDYVDNPHVGAMMGSAAIRKALQYAYTNEVGMFHVHQHPHAGLPGFSRLDAKEISKFAPDFFHVRPAMPHGAIVLSLDSAYGLCWMPTTAKPILINEYVFVGSPMRRVRT